MREADNLITFMCRMSWKSGSLNLLEPSGPHRACYGAHLPFTYINATADSSPVVPSAARDSSLYSFFF
jgi:hypothetical protein